MKTLASLSLVFLVLILPELVVFYLWQSDGEILWRIFKDWLTVIVPLAALAGVIFAAWRGKSYKELQELASTREKKISDQKAEIIRLETRIQFLENLEQLVEIIELRQQGDKDKIHRTKG